MQTKILAATCLSALVAQASANNGARVASGLIQSFIHEDLSHQIHECINNEYFIEAQSLPLLTVLRQGGKLGYAQAIKLTSQIVRELPAELDDCEGITQELHKLRELAATFDNEADFSKMVDSAIQSNYSQIESASSDAL